MSEKVIVVTMNEVRAARIAVRMSKRLGHEVDPLEQQLADVHLPEDDAPKFRLGKGPNKRVGFSHNHSGMSECGMAYVEHGAYRPCRRYVNHEGKCGYEDNTAF